MRRSLWRGVVGAVFVSLLCVLALVGCGRAQRSSTSASQEAAQEETTSAEQKKEQKQEKKQEQAPTEEEADEEGISEDGSYTSKEDVALYLHTYGHLPDNFVTKDEAEDAGWKTEGLNVDEACPGKSIGGDRFGNREGKLPKAKGRTWYECDIDYTGGRSRGAKRIVYSNDGLIYYTDDHYKSFEQLY